ncbi:hypothetical protein TNCV_4820671 [Trichonephila clavipes]|nr:hypothetical protein TNCV_4820671 [Trichonephila clavipes]
MLRSTIRTNPTLASSEVDFKLGIPPTTALDHIKSIGFVSSSLSRCYTNEVKMEIILRYSLNLAYGTEDCYLSMGQSSSGSEEEAEFDD